MPATPVATVRLRLPPRRGLTAEKDVRMDLSMVEPVGQTLFVASDETATIERLHSGDGGRSYGGHRPERLSAFFDLPVTPEEDAPPGQGDGHGEVDIEGACYDDSTGYFWVTGSMSRARRKPKPDEHDGPACLERLTTVREDPNRFLLGRIPCAPVPCTPMDTDGVREAGHDLVRKAVIAGRKRRAACLKLSAKGGNALTKALRRDVHLGRFLEVPAKENGFDVEGLAARGDRLWLGCRGPVLRGWATLLDLVVAEGGKGRLTLTPVGPDDQPYRKHFLDLDGLGIRDLKLCGDDLLILAGPTMDLDGPVSLWRWPGAVRATEEQVLPRSRLHRIMELPYGRGEDHAEGIALLPGADGRVRLLVAYDSPAPARLHGAEGVDLDLFDLDLSDG
ncbi:DUF3616 domain-containing protein [Oleisolibacter albus]|uniref:DUF3616 domain-containing protein n=1 Tax=Oleisolibacter albus TaxID=2171757 RepID=UPI000DF432DD|nr:DUF3616 domain-containing protein [Oleisolibacter albus]